MMPWEWKQQLAGSIELLRSKLMVSRVLNQMPLDISYFAQGNT